ncbi:hypothetical protein [Zavarzinia sp.]|uniref:DUF6984 family protein n=1 Tax=Zavarzinia sp. TaxID=2027920 RepID=UPI0035637EA3
MTPVRDRPFDIERDAYLPLLRDRPLRPLRVEEKAVIATLAQAFDLDRALVSTEALARARVKEMPDGGMGSLRFIRRQGGVHDVGRVTEPLWARDEDDVPVAFTLFLDEAGQLFELDVWKVDYSPLRRYPRPGDLSPTAPDL